MIKAIKVKLIICLTLVIVLSVTVTNVMAQEKPDSSGSTEEIDSVVDWISANAIELAMNSTNTDSTKSQGASSSFLTLSPYGTIEKSIISVSDRLESIDMASIGLHVRKDHLFANFSTAIPWYNDNDDVRSVPCLDLSIGVKISRTVLFAGKLVEFGGSYNNEISSPFYCGANYTSSSGRISLNIGTQLQIGKMDFDDINRFLSIDIDQWYHSISLSGWTSLNLGLVSPYAFASVDRWDLGATNAEYTYNFGVGILFGHVPHLISAIVKQERASNVVVLKPNVYLYPVQQTDVDVYVIPNGKILKSIPTYGTGWHVLAHPDGSIPNTEGYLFYEADVNLDIPDRGWSVPGSDLKSFFENKLQAYGFNKTEICDFVEFWTMKLPSSPYYTVCPAVNSVLDSSCPLEIKPKPDNILRLWFIFNATSSKVNIEPPDIEVFDRSGFVVTEWGGIIRGQVIQ